ncbi:hypothetical protein K435DRAFT_775126 [Dendrothele bispora CBS 962.96]|uniref:Uncharacterized protein n=1 Tax=Dendrothele bispora (strain CBS 962.96) TaxID=1314807 RepID=A0A4S8ML73_DENBC|nr:hypothetical protein K435DRAFT_775126 [Dendrothele bispora CBS 962.96]
MHELTSNEHTAPDDLFLERFEAFMAKSLAEIRAFSERENMSFEKTRKRVAQWHSKYLFQLPQSHSTDASNPIENDRLPETRSILMQASYILENLCEVAGIESFLLAVDPHDPGNESFLGGSVIGREFWRGFRNGGEHGARTFKQYCLKTKPGLDMVVGPASTSEAAGQDMRTLTSKESAKSIKLELYESVRNALRVACGIRNAEMKWTNPDRLHAYGVYLVGWPEDIPKQNPSTLKLCQNRRLLGLLESGQMKFMRIATSATEVPPMHSSPEPGSSSAADDESDNFNSWIQFDDNSSGQQSNTMKSLAQVPSIVNQESMSSSENPPRPPKRPRIHEQLPRSELADEET